MYTKARFSTFVPFTCLCHCVQPCFFLGVQKDYYLNLTCFSGPALALTVKVIDPSNNHVLFESFLSFLGGKVKIVSNIVLQLEALWPRYVPTSCTTLEVFVLLSFLLKIRVIILRVIGEGEPPRSFAFTLV